jgi:putative lipase involved disintegration of autophagic bodies
VANRLNDPWKNPGNITVVGHSLGGGVAGFVGAIYGVQGVLFDNMPFNNAAAKAYADSIRG